MPLVSIGAPYSQMSRKQENNKLVSLYLEFVFCACVCFIWGGVEVGMVAVLFTFAWCVFRQASFCFDLTVGRCFA